jgi:calcium-dependent protein kinase
MGNKTVKQDLQEVQSRAAERAGKIAVSGRYHRLPKKTEDDYHLEAKALGSGYNGSVFLATSKASQQPAERYAIKGFKLHGVSREKKEELETECEIFLSMDHPHVCRLVDVYESEDQLNLVMECMEGGELFARVTERKRFSEKDAAEAAYQMLLAVNYIHSHEICHRDIKLENFLYEKKDGNHLKLIDFGFSKIWDHSTKMQLSCGTLAYVAPEVLDKSYTNKCDLWSLGVVIFILLVGYMPFSGNEQHQVQSIRSGKCTFRPESWKKVSKEASEFVAKLLVVDPVKRLSAEEALKEQWITKRNLHNDQAVDQETVDALCAFAQASVFRRACMSVMAWSLTNEERSQVRESFMEMDKDHKGVITLPQFKQILEEKFHVDDATVIQAFKALDSSHTDEIHYSDFLAAMVTSRIKMHDELLAQTFRRFDTDNTGYISKDNLKQLLGDTFEGQEIDKLLAEADFTHDGKISYKEFIQYIKSDQAPAEHIEATNKLIDNEHTKSQAVAPKESSQKNLRMKTGLKQDKDGGPQKKTEGDAAKKGCGCSIL